MPEEVSESESQYSWSSANRRKRILREGLKDESEAIFEPSNLNHSLNLQSLSTKLRAKNNFLRLIDSRGRERLFTV